MSINPDDIVTGEDKEWQRTASLAQTRDWEGAARKFPEVTGLCRTCSQSLIRRRAYSEVPSVMCQKLWQQAHQVPLDIKECSGYERNGQMSLHDMHQLGIIVDSRKKGGQYL